MTVSIFSKIINYVKSYWSKPPEGKHLSLKEAAAYCVGGMGVYGALVLPQYITLTAGSYYAAALNIHVDHIMLIGIITSIVTILRAPIYSALIDNTNSKYGKFRPYLIWMPIPILLSTFAIGWIPSIISNYTGMLVAFTILFNVMQFFMGLYSLAFTTLLQVITPDQNEKEMLMGIGTTIYSLGSSIVSFLFPLLANLMFSVTGADGVKRLGINEIGTYRWILPVMLLIFLAAGYWTALGTKERTIKSKEYKQRVSLWKGMAATAKNKYFWISAAGGWLGTLKLFSTSFTAWICTYLINNNFAQSIAVTIIGMAYVPGMVFAPLMMRKWGKKAVIIVSNFLILLFTIPMVFFAKESGAGPYLLLACNALIVVANSVQVVTTPALQTMIFDYQQYKTGDRMEGAITQLSAMITTAIGIGTAFILPAIYKANGYFDNTDVLYKPSVIYPIIRTALIVSIVSSAVSMIPMFFWDLSEKKHNGIIEILKVRAASEDGTIEEETASELESLIHGGDNDAYKNYLKENVSTAETAETVEA